MRVPKALRVLIAVFTVIVIILILWIGIASTVFRFRHPWATSTEVFLNMDKALGFRKVTRQELRGE